MSRFSEQNEEKLVELTLDLKHETKPGNLNEGAYLVHDGDPNSKPFWIPKSLVERDGNKFTLPEWLAIKVKLE